MIDDATTKKIVLNNGGRYSVPDVEYWLQDGEIIFSPAALELYTRAIEQLARQEQREEAKDAERYRALIASGKYCPSSIGGYWALVTCCAKPITKAEMDEAVDKAIRASGKENGNE